MTSPLLSFPGRVYHALKLRTWYHRELRVYSFPLTEPLQLPRSTLFRRDCLDDLDYYERAAKEQQPPDAYRQTARERMAQGFHFYSYVSQRRLLHYGWLIPRQSRGVDGWVDQVYFPPADTSVLFDHFTHPAARGCGLYYQALCHLLHEAQEFAAARQAYVTVFGSNTPSRHVIEKAGFEYEGSLCKERRLLWSRRYSIAARGEFRTALL